MNVSRPTGGIMHLFRVTTAIFYIAMTSVLFAGEIPDCVRLRNNGMFQISSSTFMIKIPDKKWTYLDNNYTWIKQKGQSTKDFFTQTAKLKYFDALITEAIHSINNGIEIKSQIDCKNAKDIIPFACLIIPSKEISALEINEKKLNLPKKVKI